MSEAIDHIVKLTAPSGGVVKDNLYAIGGFVGVALDSADEGDLFLLRRRGLVTVPKVDAVAISEGAVCYLGTAADAVKATSASTSGKVCGICVESALAADEYVDIVLASALDAPTVSAAATTYDNSGSGLAATDAQAAIDEIKTAVDAAGTGDVVGPAGATDEALARFDGATGKLLKDGPLTSATGGSGENGKVPLLNASGQLPAAAVNNALLSTPLDFEIESVGSSSGVALGVILDPKASRYILEQNTAGTASFSDGSNADIAVVQGNAASTATPLFKRTSDGKVVANLPGGGDAVLETAAGRGLPVVHDASAAAGPGYEAILIDGSTVLTEDGPGSTVNWPTSTTYAFAVVVA